MFTQDGSFLAIIFKAGAFQKLQSCLLCQHEEPEEAICYTGNMKEEEEEMYTRVISHEVSCTPLLESTVSKGVEKGRRDMGKAVHAFVAC